MTVVGSPMTAASAVRPWHRRTWTGRSPMLASTTRRSRAAPEPFPDVPSVSRRTTRPRHAPATPTAPGLAGSRSLRSPPPQATNAPRQGAPRSPRSAAGASTTAGASKPQQRAGTHTSARTAMAPTPALNALTVLKGHTSARGRLPLPNPRTRGIRTDLAAC